MSLIDWNTQLMVGVAQIDDEHEVLVSKVNALADAMAGGEESDRLASLFGEVVYYTMDHFAHEEHLMAFHHYPEVARHRQEHDELKIQIVGLREQTDGGGMAVTVHTLAWLSNWLTAHISRADRAFAQYLLAQGVH